WNPVQAGTMTTNDCQINGSGVTTYSNDGTTIHTHTQPMQWNPTLGRSNVEIDQTVSFVSGYDAIRIDYTVTNNESFSLTYADQTHEAPVLFANGLFGTAHLAYTG